MDIFIALWSSLPKLSPDKATLKTQSNTVHLIELCD